MNDFIQPLSDEHKDIYFIQGELNARYPYSHSLLVGDYLIDTGISSKRLRKLKKLFPINHVFLSHWHEDHISGNYLLKDAKFHCHLKDKPLIEDIEKMIPYYNVAGTPIEDDMRKLIEVLRMKNVKIDYLLEENQIIDIGDELKLQIIYTPGHTAGHCSFYELNTKVAFLGDIDLSKYPYYGNIDASLIEFENSIDRIKNLDVNIVVTGHRGVIEGRSKIREEIDIYESILQERDERILSYFPERSKPIKLIDFKYKNIIYRKYTAFKDFELIAELLMIEKHFEKFLKCDIISKQKDGYILD